MKKPSPKSRPYQPELSREIVSTKLIEVHEEDRTCPTCFFPAKNHYGLQLHMLKHSKAGVKKLHERALLGASIRQSNKNKPTTIFTPELIQQRRELRKATREAAKHVVASIPKAEVKFCPCCGCNINAVAIALAFKQQ